MFLTKEQILKKQDLPVETVYIKEWDGEVRVRGLTGKERDDFERIVFSDQETGWINFRAKLIALTVIDDKGELLFSSSDIQELGKKSGNALDKIFAVAQRLSGLRKEDVDEITKNSENQSKDSNSN